MQTRKFLIICRRAPYDSSVSGLAVQLAMAAAAFDQPLALLFIGDGVLQLLPGQQPGEIGEKSIEKHISALTLYDIDQFYVDEASLRERGMSIDNLAARPKPLNAGELPGFCADYDVVFNF